MQFKVKPLALAITVVVLMFGGIALSDALNYWKTESSRVPATYTSGEYAGTYNPADIRGSYSFLDISNKFGIPIENLAKAFGLKESENAEAFLCKDLESRYTAAAEKGYEIGTDSVRVFVALYKGLPMELTDTYISDTAYQVLKDNISLTPSHIDYLDLHSVDLDALEAAKDVEETTPEEQSTSIAQTAPVEQETPANNEAVKPVDALESHESGEDRLINGKTTFKELLDWGVTEEEIKQIIGKDMPNTRFSVRDFCEEQGIEFSSIKTALQSVLDKQ